MAVEAGVADMINIRDLTEDSLLENLEIRYNKNLIYTYTGSILVAMNPYQLLPLYSMNMVKQYTGKRLGLLPPHVFATADDSFRSMSDDSKNQSIIISGESGAGKTETTKLILQFLSARTSANARTSVVEKKILESSPILEAFGNAKTVRNNNSSRFGKYMEIHFDNTDSIVSARIVQYLLEKSRIVQQAESERNYHVFYQLLQAPKDLLAKLFLTRAEDYSYLNTSGCIQIENVDDREDYDRMVSAMTTIGFSPKEQHSIFECISAVLHIGNLKFKLLTQGKGEASDVANPEVITTISQLLKCDPDLLSKSIRQRINFIRGEKFVVPLSQTEASDNRDALAKTIYSTLFAWLVDKINYCILEGQAVKKKKAFIGVLDIFGFENFKINSFEQLCINFTNEKLQQHFNQHIFKLEQEEYKREQIAWANIEFVDNQECIDLIEKKPIGIISLLDEECRFPKGTDITWLEKMHTNYAKHPNYEKPRTSKNTFIIKHYAGDVSYTVHNFLEKNKDTLQEELMDLLCNSGNDFVENLFSDVKAEKERAKKEAESGGTMKKQTNKTTAATKFKEQLLALVATLTSTSPHYVRCLKPNAMKSPNQWDAELVMAQLRYAGMMETIRIRKLGYPIRFSFKDFTDRYRVLTNGLINAEPRAQVQQIIDASKIQSAFIQLGLTKVFMKDGQRGVLEDLRNVAVTKCIIKMQKTYKMYKAKKRYQKIKKAANLGQKLIRRYLARVHYLKLKESTLLAQSLTRMRKARKAFVKQREAIVLAQSLWRRRKAMKLLAKLKEEKRKREEAERKERERLAAERAHLAQQEREALEAQDREREKLAREAEHQRAREEAEAETKMAHDKKQKESQEKAAAQKEKQEKESEENLKNLGIFDDLNDLARVLTTSKSSGNLLGGIPPPPPPSFDDGTPSKPKEALDLTQLDDMDLLDAMMNEDFFGDIPSFVPNSLDQLAGDYVNSSALPSFDFLATTSLNNPPPPPPASFDDLDLPPPPPPMDDMSDLPPPPPVSTDFGAQLSSMPPPVGSIPPPATTTTKVKVAPVESKEKIRERPTGVDRVTPKLINPPSEPPKIIMPEEIENYLFKTYAIKHFREPKKKSKKPSELYTWTKKSLEGGSILKSLTGEDVKTAEQVFAKIQGYMGENKKAGGEPRELVKFIISKGITNKNLRDEIFCQICKQTNDNPDKESKKKGWELMAYCTSFFPSSDELSPYLASYILAELQLREGERDIAGYCIRALRRSIQNGAKKVPPCSAEMDAIDKRAPAPIRVRFMDGTDLVLLADSATTAGEMITAIINTLKMVETQGFGLFEVYNNMARKLGQSDHLMDAIAKSENLQKQMVSRNLKISFNLLFKKSIFVDDKHFYDDLIARDLVFAQLSHDLVEGGFPVSIEVATKLAALKQVADSKNGRSFDYKKVVPIPLLPSRTEDVWRALIEKEHIQFKKMTPDEAIDEWLLVASKQPLFGSTLFNDVNVKDPKDNAHYDVVINRKGIQTLTKNTTEIRTSYPISEIRNWNCQDSPNVLTVSVGNIGQVVFTREGEAFRMAAILKEYVDALQGVGWAVTNIDFSSTDPDLLSFKKGDVIFVKRKDQNGWYTAEFNEQEGSIQEDQFDILVGNPAETGAVILAGPAKRKEVAPTMPVDSGATINSRASLAPPGESGATLSPRGSPSPRGSLNVGSGETLRDFNMSTLRDLGMETMSSSSTIRFRQTKRRTVKPGEDPMSKMKWQKDPISNSLLELPSALNKEAKESFTLIMKFMGDAPNKAGDKVVGDLIQLGCDQEELRDEIYAQVVKQSTNNPRRESNVKGWELLAMVCGSFLPSPDIQPMIVQHVTNPPHDNVSEKWSAECVEAMRQVREKGNRKRGPIPEEVTAILNGAQIVPRYFSMDGTRKAFKVSSHTTVREVNVELCGKYDISVYSGFGLCEHNSEADTITPLPEDSYICDYYNLWTSSGKMDTVHKFLFKRRVLTVDPTADMGLTTQNPTVFAILFHETLYEFKNGRILVQTDDLPALIALQLQIREGEKASEITKQGIAPLLPKHLQSMQLTDEFISKVGVQRFEFKNLTPADCKLYIMRILTTKDLYGACIFPLINVKSPKVSYNRAWIVITRKTLAIHDPHEKDAKQSFAYDYITRAFVEEGNLTMVVGSLMRDEKWILSGPDVSRIEDLIRLCKQVESKNTFVPSGW